MSVLRNLLAALGFMTRLAPARLINEEEIKKAMPYLPAAGLVLGLAVVLPFALGLFSGHPWIQAWLAVCMNAFLTRGLHLDGLCDILDASGQHTNPDKFWAIVKDSRCGAFGVAGMVLALAGQVILFQAIFSRAQEDCALLGVLVWALVLGRFGAVALAYATKPLARPGLGKLFMDGATTFGTLSALAFCALGGLFLAPLKVHFAALILLGFALAPLYFLARKVKGVNGDFLGAAIVLGECSACLGFALVF